MQMLFFASTAGVLLALFAPFAVRLLAPQWARRA